MIGAVTFEDTRRGAEATGAACSTPPPRSAYREAVRAGIDGASDRVPARGRAAVRDANHPQVREGARCDRGFAHARVPVGARGSPSGGEEHGRYDREPRRRSDAGLDACRCARSSGEQVTALRRELAEREVHARRRPRATARSLACRTVAELWGLIDSDPRKYRGRLQPRARRPDHHQQPGRHGLGRPRGREGDHRAAPARDQRVGPGGALGLGHVGGLAVLQRRPLHDRGRAGHAEVRNHVGARGPAQGHVAPSRPMPAARDISLQLLRRSDPSYLDAYVRILNAAYAVVTEAAFVNAVEATAGLDAHHDHLGDRHRGPDPRGAGRGVVLDPHQDRRPGRVRHRGPGRVPRAALQGQARQRAERDRHRHRGGHARPGHLGHPHLPVGSRERGPDARLQREHGVWHEDGPFQIDDDDVAKLGRNMAVWGMGATAVYFPTAIHRLAAT